MPGLLIGGLGIFHVFTAQFAIGGGFLMCYFQYLAQKKNFPAARRFLDGYFRFLVLLSFVIGALTGVGMWFTAIQISAPTIGLMVNEFHWLWATEWTFFCLEVVSGYAFYRYGKELSDRSRMALLILYSFAAWMSLFWINGIISFQLTPDGWLYNGSIWSGFFNRSFWPSLAYRTVASLTIAALAGWLVINTMSDLPDTQKTKLMNHCAYLLTPMLLMPLLGAWYLAIIPPDSRSWVLGGSSVMNMFLNLTMGSSLLIGLYAAWGLIRRKFQIDGATAVLLCALALSATAGGEFVREGVRKPFTVREALYSNAVRPEQVTLMRKVGITTHDPYPLRNSRFYPNQQLQLGARVYRNLCQICHTMNGTNGLVGLSASWTIEQKRMNIAKLQYTKPFMPPFAGSAQELEALVQLLEWWTNDQPANWRDSSMEPGYLETLTRIERWLQEAGSSPSNKGPAKFRLEGKTR